MPARPQTPVWGCRDRLSICLSLCPARPEEQSRLLAPQGWGGGSRSQPTHLPSDGRGRSLHRAAWRASLCLKRQAGGWGLCRENSSHGGSSENHGHQEGGQGRVCLSLGACVGQRPTVHLGAPSSHVFMAAALPWKTALPPSQAPYSQAHTGSYPSHMHPAYTPAHMAPTPPHLQNSAPWHTCTCAPGSQSLHTCAHHTPPHAAKPGTTTHTCHIYMPTHIHT